MFHDVLRDWYEWEITTLRSQQLACWSVDCRDLRAPEDDDGKHVGLSAAMQVKYLQQPAGTQHLQAMPRSTCWLDRTPAGFEGTRIHDAGVHHRLLL